jgi:hypothetical protein
MPATEGATAGLVVYRQKTEGWDGVWSHTDIGGGLAREIVAGANLDALPGNWEVQIRAPNDTILFTGSLSVSNLGKCLKLAWTGYMASGDAANFGGLGYRIDAETMAATFQKVEVRRAG